MTESLPYRDPSLPIQDRIADLLPRMTLAEKRAQLVGPFGLEESGECSIERLAERHRLEVDTEAEQAAFLFCSLLYDDCIERGKSLLGGGAHYRGGVIKTFGMVNAADSLTAIKSLVYDRKLFTLEQLLAALDADFVGMSVNSA